jgi:hypothetical protein
MRSEDDYLRHVRDLRAQIARQRLRLDARLRGPRQTMRWAGFWRRRVQRHPAAALATALAVGLGAALGLKQARPSPRSLFRAVRSLLGPLAPAIWRFVKQRYAPNASPSPAPSQADHAQ